MDYDDSGSTIITGTITYNGQPVSRKVTLITKVDHRFIATTWSDPTTGVYSFIQLEDQEYIIIAEDYLGTYGTVSHNITDQTNIEFNDQQLNDLDDYKGIGKIWGTIEDSNQLPMERRLVLLDPQTYKKVATTISNPTTGYYEFNNLSTSRIFTLIAEEDYNPNFDYNDIIRSRVTPS